ncbi:MAG: flagellar protein FlhE [Burkholderiaceae bacterium]|nr:flagellar protein FlhE [Burkholderiaceae bacterium]
MCNYFSLSLFAGASLLMAATAQAADNSWTDRQASAALTRAGSAVSTRYQAGKMAGQIPADAVITQVYANRRYAGDATVHTQLCWNGTTRCVDLLGEHLNTQAFNGLDPSQPMYLKHTVTNWGQSFPPLFVVGNVNVWFTSQSQHP